MSWLNFYLSHLAQLELQHALCGGSVGRKQVWQGSVMAHGAVGDGLESCQALLKRVDCSHLLLICSSFQLRLRLLLQNRSNQL